MSCSPTTHISSSWVKPETEPVVFDNIMVMAQVSGNRSYLQKTIEEDVAAQMREKGYNAASYFDKYGPRNPDNNDKQAVMAALKQHGWDAVLTIVLLDTTNRTHFIGFDAVYEPYDQFNGRYLGYFVKPYYDYLNAPANFTMPYYDAKYAPGYYNTDIRYFWETNLYPTSNGDLIYSAKSESLDPGSSDALAEQYAGRIVKDMTREYILLRPKMRRQIEGARTRIAKQ